MCFLAFFFCFYFRDSILVSNLVEVVLATLESKLRRVENLDRAVQAMMRKVDNVDAKLDRQFALMARDQKREENKAEERFKVLSDRMDYLTKKFDSVCEVDEDYVNPLEDIIALPSIRQSRLFQGDSSGGAAASNRIIVAAAPPSKSTEQAAKAVKQAVGDMQETVAGMDRRLAFHINIVSENLGKMSNMVREVHGAIMDEDLSRLPPEDLAFGWRRAGSLVARNQTKTTGNGKKRVVKRRRTKLDKIMSTMRPLREVREQVKTFRHMLEETQATVDTLIPASKEMLLQNQKQQEAITKIQSNLDAKTSAIIQELSDVERELAKSKKLSLPSDEADNNGNKFFLDDAEQDLDSSGSASAFIETTATGPSAVFDNSVLVSNSSSSVEFRTSTSVSEGDDEDATRGPSVIFPSVENKPIVVNSSFTYDSGRNLRGVTVTTKI